MSHAIRQHPNAPLAPVGRRRMVMSSGAITVEVANRDLFWHTFTVEDLGVDLRIPVGAERIVAFDAPPGTYQYICAIPGHPEAGMKGSLIVTDS